jgi:hypothetical protein
MIGATFEKRKREMSKGDKTWFNYTPLSTIGNEITDDGTRVFCAIQVERKPGLVPLELAIIGDEKKLDLVRVKTPDTDGDLDEEERRIVGSMSEHVVVMLRLAMHWMFVVALMIGILAILSIFVFIPFVTEYAFWVMTAAFLLLAGARL